MMEFHAIKQCPLCDSPSSRIILTEHHVFDHAYAKWSYLNQRTIDIKKCTDCGFGYSSELPEKDFFEKVLYSHPQDLNIWSPPDQKCGKEYIANTIIQLLKKHHAGEQLLDLGANSGRFLFLARNHFTSVMGIENDAKAAKMGIEFGLSIVIGGILEKLPQFHGKVDVITMIDVLEHLPNPVLHLRSIYDTLSTDGLLYIKVPHQAGQLYKEKLIALLGFRQTTMATNFLHINHFSETSLISALQAIGFEILHAQVAPPELFPGSFINLLIRQPKHFVSNTTRLLQYYMARILRSLTPINLGLNLEILAKKKPTQK